MNPGAGPLYRIGEATAVALLRFRCSGAEAA